MIINKCGQGTCITHAPYLSLLQVPGQMLLNSCLSDTVGESSESSLLSCGCFLLTSHSLGKLGLPLGTFTDTVNG